MPLSRRAVRASLSLLLLAAGTPALAQYVAIRSGVPASESFDSLVSSGTSGTLPNGWYLYETGNNANTTYAADDGSANSGNTYSYGSSGSSERALGTLLSSSLKPKIGAQLRNTGSEAISEIAVAYTGEQWRLGVASRSDPDSLRFQYSTNATSLGDAAATWTEIAALSFDSPITSGAAGPLDGNLPANRRAVSGSITGLNLAPNASLWVRWDDKDVASNDDGLAIDDITFSVAGGPPVDVAPRLLSTTPVAQASQVALDTTFAATFSEPVTLGSGWYTLACGVSGTHTLVPNGGPANYTFTVSPAFAQAENCTWTLIAAAITDLDGTPDALEGGDVAIAFTTFDPANLPPPTLVSTVPANGATNVPKASDLRVTFSEAVTTDVGAFALTCGGNALAIIETGSGANRTLTPDQLLPEGASCQFTIDGTRVRNGNGIVLGATAPIGFTVAAAVSSIGYYQRVNTVSASQLRCSLHEIIKGHTIYPYSGGATNAWTILEIAQRDPSNPNKIIDIYRNRSYNAISDRAGVGSGTTYNREHTWPNSLGFANNSLAAYTDTHMLWLSDTGQNSSRGNKPFAYCASGCTELPTEVNNGVGGPGQSNWVKTPDGNTGSFEIWNHRKGEMARAMFYMAIRYEGIASEDAHDGNIPDLELTDYRYLIVVTSNTAAKAYMGLLTDLLAWHLSDPPDAAEIARNDVIQSFQGNRNPFVDHPEWVSRTLLESSWPTACEPIEDRIYRDAFDTPRP